jgi:hypothetical protein
MKRIGYGSADDLVRDAIEFLEASTHITGDDAAAIEESERQIESGQDLDWKKVSTSADSLFSSSGGGVFSPSPGNPGEGRGEGLSTTDAVARQRLER